MANKKSQTPTYFTCSDRDIMAMNPLERRVFSMPDGFIVRMIQAANQLGREGKRISDIQIVDSRRDKNWLAFRFRIEGEAESQSSTQLETTVDKPMESVEGAPSSSTALPNP